MNQVPNKFLRYLITILLLIITVVIIYFVKQQFFTYPWTRDAQVRAIVIKIAPRVSGPIQDMNIKDNEFVKKGTLLYEIDPSLYKLDVENAKAKLDEAQNQVKEMREEYQRLVLLPNVTAKAKITTALNAYTKAQSAYNAAKASLDSANLNLTYTKIYAPVDGYITNLTIGQGTYVTAGDPSLALVNSHSYWISAYFKETNIRLIKIGDKVKVRLLGDHNKPLEGVVNSIGWGISRTDGSLAENLLPNVSPTIDWVRLAQRIPVRIQLTQYPKSFPLVVGMTASVVILTSTK